MIAGATGQWRECNNGSRRTEAQQRRKRHSDLPTGHGLTIDITEQNHPPRIICSMKTTQSTTST